MSAPLSQLTSLNLIRGFVAVGRRMSITLAAADLHLTQSALSRQVRTLEESLGVKLLERGHRSIAFTTEGARLFEMADGALRQLQDAVGAAREGRAARPVTIAASIGVVGLWLLPRLGEFLHHHPSIDVRISANNKLNNLRDDELDLTIRSCRPEDTPPNATKLFDEAIAPVAHPSLGLPADCSRDSLEAQVLLEFDGEYLPWLRWKEWLACQGWEGFKPRGMLRFNHYDQTIQAAIAGQGVALGRLQLTGEALRDGRLRVSQMPRPGPPTTHAHWLVRTESAPRSEIDFVAAWVCEEAAKVAVGRFLVP